MDKKNFMNFWRNLRLKHCPECLMRALHVIQDCAARSSCDIEDPSGVLCRSYYVCHPKPEPLEVKRCLDCGAPVRVPRYGPYCGREKPSGMWLSEFDEDQNEETIGVLCFDCADKRSEKGKLSFGSAGTYFRNEWLILDAIICGGDKR